MNLIIFIIGLSVLPLISARQCESIISGCDECIQTQGCVWCNDPNLTRIESKDQYVRCNTKENHVKMCPNHLERPIMDLKVVSNDALSKTTHIRPQEVTVRPVMNTPFTINVTYQEETDKKLDLYYLLDVSKTMASNKGQVVQQSQTLQQGLSSITSNLQMGFGSFIDKPVVPFSDSSQILEEKYRPYAFKHNLKLTSNLKHFKDTIRSTQTIDNQDIPEGTLDALMQAIVCNEVIGWRNGSRRLIVVATDDLFHIAGDGKIGGVVVPNDMECHIDEKSNLYEKATEYDYPSISQINHVVEKYGAYVIFAIVKKGNNNIVLQHYKELVAQVKFSQIVELQADSSDVVEKIKTVYKTISNKVQLVQKNFERPEEGFSVNVKVQCKPGKDFQLGEKCDDVNPGDNISFQVELTLTKCPPPSERHKNEITFSTHDLSGKGEQLRVKFDFSNCNCGCTNEYKTIKHEREAQKLCNADNAEGMKCGLCQCRNGFSGTNCECSRDTSSGSVYDNTTCISSDKQLCSGQGDCECRSCKCIKDYSGKLCECNDLPCSVDLSDPRGIRIEKCSGKGGCNCGICNCESGYEGKRCECRTDEKNSCRNPSDLLGPPCGGQGECKCTDQGKQQQFGWHCECPKDYSGTFCDIHKGSQSSAYQKQCADSRLHECLKCHLQKSEEDMRKRKESNLTDCSQTSMQEGEVKECFSSANLKEMCKEKCTSMVSEGSAEITAYNVAVTPTLNDDWSCEFMYNETCKTKFVFSYQNDKNLRSELQVRVMEVSKSLCSESLPLLYYIFAIIGSILAIGILTLLLWKLFTMWHDRVEFQKFENERAAARWDTGENPLYNTPMSQFENPTYRS